MKIILVLLAICFSFGAMAQNKTVSIQTSAQCESCKERIEKNMIFTKGVVNATLDLTTKIVNIEYKEAKTNPDELRIALANIGYDADSVKANAKAYEKLPGCCKKPGTAGHVPH